MRRYNSIKERKLQDFKAWYSFASDWWYQFPSGLLHDEIAREQLKMNEVQALNKEYARIYVYDNTINIQSKGVPNDREFNALKDKIERNTYNPKIRFTIWETNKKGFYFRNQSFFFADSILEGR